MGVAAWGPLNDRLLDQDLDQKVLVLYPKQKSLLKDHSFFLEKTTIRQIFMEL
jgi:hypothetical protein